MDFITSRLPRLIPGLGGRGVHFADGCVMFFFSWEGREIMMMCFISGLYIQCESRRVHTCCPLTLYLLCSHRHDTSVSPSSQPEETSLLWCEMAQKFQLFFGVFFGPSKLFGSKPLWVCHLVSDHETANSVFCAAF